MPYLKLSIRSVMIRFVGQPRHSQGLTDLVGVWGENISYLFHAELESDYETDAVLCTNPFEREAQQ